MDTPNLEIRTRECAPGILLVEPIGEVDLENTAAVETAVRDAVGRGRHVIVALGGLRYLDSTGLNSLRQCHAMAERLGRRLVVAEPAPVVRRVMDAIDFPRLVPVFSRTALAVAELTSGSRGRSEEERGS